MARRNSSNTFNQNWTNRSKKEGGNLSSLSTQSPHGKSAAPSTGTKHNFASLSNNDRGHIASNCPTRRTMIMKADGAITSESEISEEELEEEAM